MASPKLYTNDVRPAMQPVRIAGRRTASRRSPLHRHHGNIDLKARTSSRVTGTDRSQHDMPVRLRRLERSPELKAMVLAECEHPGASVAKVAMAHGVNANLAQGMAFCRQRTRGQARSDGHELGAVGADARPRSVVVPARCAVSPSDVSPSDAPGARHRRLATPPLDAVPARDDGLRSVSRLSGIVA